MEGQLPATADPAAPITALTYLAIATTVLRVLQEAPALVTAVADFWQVVSGQTSPPAHIEAAVQAAIAVHRRPE